MRRGMEARSKTRRKTKKPFPVEKAFSRSARRGRSYGSALPAALVRRKRCDGKAPPYLVRDRRRRNRRSDLEPAIISPSVLLRPRVCVAPVSEFFVVCRAFGPTRHNVYATRQ